MMPWESGDLMKRIKIRTMTRHGNRSTKASGIEIDESPFNRIRRRKKDSGGEAFSVRRDDPSGFSGLSLEDGTLLVTSCEPSIVVFE